MKRVKWLAMVLLLVLGMTFAACGDSGSSGGKSSDKSSKKKTSYEAPIKDLMSLINKQSTDIFEYQKCIMMPKMADYNKELYDILKKNDDVKEEYEDLQEDVADYYDDIKGFKLTGVEYIEKEEMKNKELRKIEESFDSSYFDDILDEFDDMDDDDYEDAADSLDISVSDVKKIIKSTKTYIESYRKIEVSEGYEVTVQFTAEYDGDEDETEEVTIRVINVNGEWYIYDAYSLFSYGFYFEDDLDDINLYYLYSYIQRANYSNTMF